MNERNWARERGKQGGACEKTSEWPCMYFAILGCSEPWCDKAKHHNHLMITQDGLGSDAHPADIRHLHFVLLEKIVDDGETHRIHIFLITREAHRFLTQTWRHGLRLYENLLDKGKGHLVKEQEFIATMRVTISTTTNLAVTMKKKI